MRSKQAVTLDVDFWCMWTLGGFTLTSYIIALLLTPCMDYQRIFPSIFASFG